MSAIYFIPPTVIGISYYLLGKVKTKYPSTLDI